MNPELRTLRTDLLKSTIARQLVARGVAAPAADEIAASGVYDAFGDTIIVDFPEGRATESADHVTSIAERLALRASPPPKGEEQNEMTPAERRVADKRAFVSGAF